jgi:hypothetical protein
MISTRVAPPLRCSIATTRAVLLPARGELVSRTLAAFWPLGARGGCGRDLGVYFQEAESPAVTSDFSCGQ